MLKKERQAFILHQLNLHNKLLNTELCGSMHVSEDTIRRDLQELSDIGKLIKVHGGALSTAFSELRFPLRASQFYAKEFKTIIAEKAISLIKDGMFVLTGGGTTILEMASNLPPQLRATFVTGSIVASNIYAAYPNIETIVVGGKLSKDSRITIGADAINRISEMTPDLCILGTNAIDQQFGITDNDWEVVQLKKAMIRASKKMVVLSIAEKLNTSQPLKVCGLDEIDYLITELNPTHSLLLPFKEAGICVL